MCPTLRYPYQETESGNLYSRRLLRHGFEGSAHDGGGGEGAGDEGGAEEGELGDGEGAVGEGEGNAREGGEGKRRQAGQLGGEEELPTREKEGTNFWTIPERRVLEHVSNTQQERQGSNGKGMLEGYLESSLARQTLMWPVVREYWRADELSWSKSGRLWMNLEQGNNGNPSFCWMIEQHLLFGH